MRPGRSGIQELLTAWNVAKKKQAGRFPSLYEPMLAALIDA